MAGEIERTGIPFTDIHINLTDQTITLKKKMKLSQRLFLRGNYQLQELFSSAANRKASWTVRLTKNLKYHSPLLRLPARLRRPKSERKRLR
jgi:hypothetical protein